MTISEILRLIVRVINGIYKNWNLYFSSISYIHFNNSAHFRFGLHQGAAILRRFQKVYENY
jgi:hypothetical protein